MYIILVANRTRDPGYKDVPFRRYHFPNEYLSSIRTGYAFIYNQGNRQKKNDRIYYGMGIIGDIYPDPDQPDHHFADLVDAVPFDHPISIYYPAGGYYESLNYEEVKKSPKPAWQNAIRRISKAAFDAIVANAKMQEYVPEVLELREEALEISRDWLSILADLNTTYADATPGRRTKILDVYLDRGFSVANALKRMLDPICQICGLEGFMKRSGQRYIEVHHLVQVSEEIAGSLCSDNLVLVCPTCHRKLHYADVSIQSTPSTITISINGDEPVTFKRNTIEYLLSKQASQSSGKLVKAHT